MVIAGWNIAQGEEFGATDMPGQTDGYSDFLGFLKFSLGDDASFHTAAHPCHLCLNQLKEDRFLNISHIPAAFPSPNKCLSRVRQSCHCLTIASTGPVNTYALALFYPAKLLQYCLAVGNPTGDFIQWFGG